ncbi:SanA/YdcF family protein [Aestuariimicrobium soli]|uniref:SanA/YdcF family protein n=1 Tax=Aestuariimicrobium soli TaxID=2035834 RepID=UPI003EB908F3
MAVGLTAIAVIALAPAAVVQVAAAGHQHNDVATAPANDVVLVLGAGVRPDGQPSAFLRARLDVAADLVRAGKARVILVSGDNRAQNYNEPKAMKRYLVEQRGIPAGKVVEDFAGFDTYDSCVRAKRIFGVEKLTLVTQDFHLPRAVATCRLVGVDTEGVGDQTAKVISPGTWRYGVVRELPAAWKTLYDVVSRRTPTLGSPESSVKDAINS